jgi:hypothetical protein
MMIPACRSLGLALTTCLFLPALTAQSGPVIPSVAHGVDGNERLPTAFGSTAFRLQQIVEGPALAANSATLNRLGLRADRPALPMGQALLPNLSLSVGETTVAPLAMGEGFAQNQSGATTLVFQGGLALPPELPTARGPAPFSIQLPFTQPVTIRTGAGFHLLLDLVATDPNPTSTGYALDAAISGGATEEVGRAGQLGTGDNLNFVAYGANGPTSLTPGGQVEFATTTSFASYPGATLLGLLPYPQPIDLTVMGAPGNEVLVDGLGAVGHSWQRTFIGWAAPVALAVPAAPGLVGASLWGQSVLIEPTSSALGLVTTAAQHVVLGAAGSDPVQAVVAADPAAGLGSWAFGASAFGGAVLELRGSFL